MNEQVNPPADRGEPDEDFYVLFAEGGGWPDHCVGPFWDHDTAEEYMVSDKWRESWGSVTNDPRDLPVHVPDDACAGCGTPIFRDRHGTYIDMTGGDVCEDHGHHPQPAADQVPPPKSPETRQAGPDAADTGEPRGNDHHRDVPRFEFDTDAARAALTAAAANGDLPTLWSESPARSIDTLFYDLSEHLICPPDYDRYDVGVYPLIYESDPDGILLVVRRPTPLPTLADGPWDWEDLAPRDAIDRDLTVDETLGIVREIVRYANDLLARAGQERGQ